MKNILILGIALSSVTVFANKNKSQGSTFLGCADAKNRNVVVELANPSDVNSGYLATVRLGAAVEVDHQPIARGLSISSEAIFHGQALEISFPIMQPDYIAPTFTHAAGTIKVRGFDDNEVNLLCWRVPLFKDTLPTR
jgi:hypothetical protein